MKKIYRVLFIVGMALGSGAALQSCSLDPEQSNAIDVEQAPIRDAVSLKANINGLYAIMKTATYYGRDIFVFSDVRTSYAFSSNRSGRFGNVSGAGLQPGHAYAADTWNQIYRMISNTNRILESPIEQTAEVKFMLGQAYVLRGLGHYDLLRLYGQQHVEGLGLNGLGVPYKSEYGKDMMSATRGTVGENKTAILADIAKGIALMEEGKAAAGTNNTAKSGLTLAAAYGFQSRIALYFTPFDSSMNTLVAASAEKAIAAAGNRALVVNRGGFLDSYKGDAQGTNSIMELTQTGTDNISINGLYYIYYRGGGSGYGDVQVLGDDVTAFFPTKNADGELIEDIRAEVIGKSIEPSEPGVLRNYGKWTALTSNIKMMRIEEMYLNYAEAVLRGGEGDAGKALEYINLIASNRIVVKDPADLNAPGTPFAYKSITLEDVRQERMKELMFEGFGFEDLMRFKGSYTNIQVSASRYPDGVVTYGSPFTTFPIPQGEINVSGIPQNKGY